VTTTNKLQPFGHRREKNTDAPDTVRAACVPKQGKIGYNFRRVVQLASAGFAGNVKSNRANPGETDNGHLRPL
jgi:hypothetical protein